MHRVNDDPGSPDFYQDPYKSYATYPKNRVFYWEHYQLVCFAGFEDVSRILRDRRFGRIRPKALPPVQDKPPHLADFYRAEAHSLLNLEPPDHTRLRALINRAFIARHVNALQPSIAAAAHDCCEKMMQTAQPELIRDYATPIPSLMIARMFDLPEADIPKLLDWSHRMVVVYTLNQTNEQEHSANEAAREFTDYLKAIIAARRENPSGIPGEDLLSHLIHARPAPKPEEKPSPSDAVAQTTQHESDALTDDEIISTTILLLNAGHEATVHQIGNAVATILRSGLSPEALFSDSAQTQRTVDEIMRFCTPLHLFTRIAQVDIDDVAGQSFSAGDEVGLLLGAANRDPRRFADADKFDPFRSDSGNLSLGAGVHYCAGAALAKLELTTALPILFERFPNLRLTQEPQLKNSWHFHGFESVWLRCV